LKVLVIGSGAREHSIAWKFSKSKRISGLYIAPGNAGTAEVGTNCPDIDPLDFSAISSLCLEKKIDLVFVGPESPLSEGIVDYLENESIPVIGPSQKAAQLESSKVHSKSFMQSHGIPTADAREYHDFAEFKTAVDQSQGRVVVKKNGLAAGKGVLESQDRKNLLAFGKKILASDSLLLEEYLEGFELSVFALIDGENYLMLPFCADFKKAGDNDIGPNTGGMGSVCPVPTVGSSLENQIETEIVVPTINALKSEGQLYQGILYFGLMVTESGPKMLEFNVRLGDPESQVLLPIINSDFGNLSEAIVNKSLNGFPLCISNRSAVGVVVASRGYPDKYKKGVPVRSLPSSSEETALIFHASTKTDKNGQIVTGGGRCFTVVGTGDDTLTASEKAYAAVTGVEFDGAWCRTDIGKKFYVE
jgi:phosphoribosylamine--glycine ligase